MGPMSDDSNFETEEWDVGIADYARQAKNPKKRSLPEKSAKLCAHDEQVGGYMGVHSECFTGVDRSG